MFVKVVFTIPEGGEVTLTSEVSALVEYPAGIKALQFSSPIAFFGNEGKEIFLGIEMYEDRTPTLVEECGCYPISSLSFVNDISCL